MDSTHSRGLAPPTSSRRPLGQHESGSLADRPTQELVRELVEHSENLLREEIRLARLELETLRNGGKEAVEELTGRVRRDLALAQNDARETVSAATREVVAPVGIGALLSHAAVYLLLFAAVFGIGVALPLWAACLIVGSVVLVTGAALTYFGVHRAGEFRWNPFTHAAQRLREDGRWMNEWMTERIRSVRSDLSANA